MFDGQRFAIFAMCCHQVRNHCFSVEACSNNKTFQTDEPEKQTRKVYQNNSCRLLRACRYIFFFFSETMRAKPIQKKYRSFFYLFLPFFFYFLNFKNFVIKFKFDGATKKPSEHVTIQVHSNVCNTLHCRGDREIGVPESICQPV